MTKPVYILGIDPGPTTGIVGLFIMPPRQLWYHQPDIVQCNAHAAPGIVGHLLRTGPMEPDTQLVVAIERFVVGRGSMVSGSAGEVTRDLIGYVEHTAAEVGARVITRSAAAVKPWASAKRLMHAGLFSEVGGHARDAARHVLFAACADYGHADPLSVKGGAP